MRGRKRVPIRVAMDLAKSLDVNIVCIVTWDRTGTQHVVTYGTSKKECGYAADLGNKIKAKVLGWPEEFCNAKPKRLRDDGSNPPESIQANPR